MKADQNHDAAGALVGITRRRLIKGAGGFVAGAALASAGVRCASAQTPGEGDTLRLGVVRPMTGAMASSFSPHFVTAEIAIDEINQKGGILGKRIVKVEVDDEGSPAKQPIVMRNLIDQGVRYVIGPIGSSAAISALAVAGPQGVIQATYASADEMGDGRKYPLHYQFNFTSAAQAVRHAECLVKLKAKKIGLLTDDSAAGVSTRDALVAELPKHGLEIVSQQTFPIRVTDMTPFLRKLRNDGVDAIDNHFSFNGDVTQFLLGLSQLNWRPPTVGHSGLLYGGTPGVVPDKARYKDVYSATYKTLTYPEHGRPSERILAFARKVVDRGIPETVISVSATAPFYDFIYSLKDAAERTKSFDPAVVKRALDETKGLDGMFGKISFTEANHSAYDTSAVTMALVNSTADEISKEYKGLFRRDGLGIV